jgi:hypothetical protein
MDELKRDQLGRNQLERDRLGGDQLERFSQTGTSYIARDRHTTDRIFLCLYVSARYLGRIDSDKQCFHNHFMYTCLLRAT